MLLKAIVVAATLLVVSDEKLPPPPTYMVGPVGTCTYHIGADTLLLKSTQQGCARFGGIWTSSPPDETDSRCGNCKGHS